MARPTRLNILLYTRADAEVNSGGDLVEARRLCAGLIAAGHHAVVAGPDTNHGSDWDVVHLFNIDRAAELAVFLKRHDFFPGARVVLAPVFSLPSVGQKEPVARTLRPITNLVFGSLRPSRFWLPGLAVTALRSRVDALHFHTAAEQREFNRSYPGFAGPSAIIPPPVDEPPFDSNHPLELPFDGPYLAAVGRIEPLKNQLWMIASGIAHDLPIVFVGPLNPKRPVYSRRFVRLVKHTGEIHWLGRLDPPQVRQVLQRAIAHILPSRRENFGLATLEALDAGCEAIVPSHHFVNDELGDALHSFDLNDVTSLEAVVGEVVSGSTRAGSFSRERYAIPAVTEAVVRLYGDGQGIGTESAT